MWHFRTGTSSLTLLRLSSEWAMNQHRDTLASHLGHTDMLAYFAVVENESMGRVRYNILEKMLQPCGPPPPKEEE
ncbi:hypothetical protein PsorP6_013157 [Peronosclerospora sorghi]|uniref:Uncharacterized protein n=1 Tax=Peronosclerospora sorghi TaxID=230839 RepID=A0ACC0WJT4_9STRA|nr:hypothetical protein PsorP6_013157 [Peronosclerospora sorghi]